MVDGRPNGSGNASHDVPVIEVKELPPPLNRSFPSSNSRFIRTPPVRKFIVCSGSVATRSFFLINQHSCHGVMSGINHVHYAGIIVMSCHRNSRTLSCCAYRLRQPPLLSRVGRRSVTAISVFICQLQKVVIYPLPWCCPDGEGNILLPPPSFSPCSCRVSSG